MEIKTNIPKHIHYCWFGGKEKPELIKKCIKSWEIYLPDYQVTEWNETNFNVDGNQYVKEAYKAGKYAFVSDYARVYALYHYGGIYLDTDVEVFRSFNDLLHYDSFWGFEQENYIATSTIGAAKGNRLIKLFLDHYRHKSFLKADGSYNELTNVATVTRLFEQLGLERNGKYQEIEETAVVFPQAFFSPYDYINHRSLKNAETYAMHHFHKSWLPANTKMKSAITLFTAKVIGGENIAKIRERFK